MHRLALLINIELSAAYPSLFIFNSNYVGRIYSESTPSHQEPTEWRCSSRAAGCRGSDECLRCCKDKYVARDASVPEWQRKDNQLTVMENRNTGGNRMTTDEDFSSLSPSYHQTPNGL